MYALLGVHAQRLKYGTPYLYRVRIVFVVYDETDFGKIVNLFGGGGSTIRSYYYLRYNNIVSETDIDRLSDLAGRLTNFRRISTRVYSYAVLSKFRQ